jgi:hypothetical protein
MDIPISKGLAEMTGLQTISKNFDIGSRVVAFGGFRAWLAGTLRRCRWLLARVCLLTAFALTLTPVGWY